MELLTNKNTQCQGGSRTESGAEKSFANAPLNEPSADCSSRALGFRALREILNVIAGHLFYTGACDKQLFNAAPPLSAQPQSAISAFV